MGMVKMGIAMMDVTAVVLEVDEMKVDVIAVVLGEIDEMKMGVAVRVL